MSITRPPQGTHFSDGVRTGAFLQSQFLAGGNVYTPATQVGSAVDTQPPGIYNTPLALHDVFPYPVNATALAASQTPASAGYLTLITTSGPGVKVMANFGGVTGPSSANVIQLDTPRNVTITSAGNDSSVNWTVFGWDQYGLAMAEQITGANVGAATGKKAFYIVQAIYGSAATASTVTAGVGNTFGLPYFCPDADYYFQPMWAGLPDPLIAVDVAPTPIALGTNPITTTNTSSTVVVAVSSTAGLQVGTQVTMAGLTATGGITAAQLNIEAAVTAVVANTSFSYVAGGSATSSTTGGGSAGTYTNDTQVASAIGTVTPAVQLTATATTGDVRGTYTPSTAASGSQHLVINFYAPSGDYRKYSGASNSASIILNNNALSATNTSTTITVLAPNHQLTGGELVSISGATTFAGISTGNLNLSNVPVTIVDASHFTFVAGAAATSTASGGGAAISLTPSKGNLYQIPVGRFGVTQYSAPLF